ncbi:DcaP family trimeric outer membrane transporter [Marinobacter sp. S6332]|uniref:DcaP family trimeric outer membrane transporter n=1 Tax=Marinobacter sp. S6332 TaxID=2926403 RepID=UPI001FF0E409|nr:DcaP family trimeric outer membrane transporter [Marinobacter sp. S6332]MCK0162363.1 DcaP family trimeric outer membrane transporter [Marinobacter sp. S6332]
MQSNKLRMAIRATAAVAVLGVAGQAQAFDFKAGDVDASVYGYARLSMSYDIDENLASANNVQSGDPNTIAGGDVDGHFGASANQSRFGIKATNADGVMMNIEGDFAFGSGRFRLRHGYGSYNGVLAGQTWSNYNSFVASTPTLDFNGVVGNAGYQSRTAQLRYTTGAMSFSVEDPKSSVPSGRDSTPAFTARFENSSGGMGFSAAAVVKQNSYDDGTNDDSTLGFGVFGAASFAISDMFTIRGALNYVDGATSYLYLSGGSDAVVQGTSLENNSGMGGTLGTSIKLGGGSSINVAYGMTTLDDENLAAGATEANQNLFVNYMWTPVKNVMMGVEYGYHENEKQSGASEDANRVMFAAQYNF